MVWPRVDRNRAREQRNSMIIKLYEEAWFGDQKTHLEKCLKVAE